MVTTHRWRKKETIGYPCFVRNDTSIIKMSAEVILWSVKEAKQSTLKKKEFGAVGVSSDF